jgi:1-deoxy-D-xylulose-5-phosphate reductoisomerase
MDLAAIGSLTFERPDLAKFPCLELAYEALRLGGSAGCVVNAANEVAVFDFLRGAIKFTDIPKRIEFALSHIEHVAHPSLADILHLDHVTRTLAH